MQRRSLVAVLAVVLSLAAGRADAVTVRDVIELSKAGLSESVLLALIDVERSVFSIDTATLKQLKSAGVSDAVIVAMIRSGREPRVEETMPPVVQEPAQAPEPQEPVSPVEAMAPPPAPYPVAFPVPVYMAVPIAPIAPAHGAARRAALQQPVQPLAVVAPNCQSAQVPNWGFGGTIRQLPPVCR
jgi:hypothetical protein